MGKMSKSWKERYVIADPEAMMLTYKEGGAAVRAGTSCSQRHPLRVLFHLPSQPLAFPRHPQGKVKGTFSLVGIAVTAYESAAEPNAFEVTATNNEGVEEKLVLAGRDEADARRWIEGLKRFAAPMQSRDDAVSLRN